MGRCFLAWAALLSAASAQAQMRPSAAPEERRMAEDAVSAFTSPALTRFRGEEEFRRYIGALRAAARARGDLRAGFAGIQYAQAQTPGASRSDAIEPICPAADPACADVPDLGESVIITGSRVNVGNPSITNNQMRGVEEGDIVKQIGRFLLVLQDGRLFVIDTRAGGGRDLRLADRINVYREPDADTWYDEMLVFGNRVLVAGYSYQEGATELSILRLSDAGRLSREGIFYVSSGDYYSASNYATRLIGDDLVIYTPLELLRTERAGFRWPVVRRWRPEGARDANRGRPLYDAADIYRPARDAWNPVVHSVSVCPLASAGRARDLECRTTAFVGPERAEWHVTDRHVYLWAAPYGARQRDRCAPGATFALADLAPALLYRVPISGARPDLVAARGFPPDQFAMQADAGGFHALVEMEPETCEEEYEASTRLSFFSIPERRFRATLAETPEAAFTALPSIPSPWIASRFTDTHLVYGGLSRHRHGFPDLSDLEPDNEYARRVAEEMRPRPAYVLPVNRPGSVRPLDVGHTVIRAERVADDIVLTGYRDRAGLTVSLIRLEEHPRIASSIPLPGRFESEGRSHAFNSLVERDGGGLLGLPTVRREEEGDRWWWRSRPSDLSFLSFDSGGRLGRLGELISRAAHDEESDGIPGYECEVSCIDWYGNSRPIFTDGRIFALTGTELVEGRIVNGRIRETGRLNIAVPAP